MASPELELQTAIVARLKADVPFGAVAGGRIYDLPPNDPVFPYATVGEAQFVRADATCIEAGDVYLTMHAWSREPGYPEVKRVAAAVVDALHLAPLPSGSWCIVSIMHRDTRTFRDPDGLTSHAVIELAAKVNRPAT